MKTVLRIGLVLISLIAIWVACFAQSGTRPTSQLPPNTPQPAPEMQSLTKALAGKWSTMYKFEPGGMVPEGGDGDGEEVWRTGPGGFTLMEEEHVRTPRGEVFLLALHWWIRARIAFAVCSAIIPVRQPAIWIPITTVPSSGMESSLSSTWSFRKAARR